MKKNEEDEHDWKKSSTTHNNDLRIYALDKRPLMPKYKVFFCVLCYTCNNYGHKVIYCRAYAQNRNTWRRNSYENSRYQFEGNYVRKPHVSLDRTYNIFGALNYEIECNKCHNFGRIARNCRSRFMVSSS